MGGVNAFFTAIMGKVAKNDYESVIRMSEFLLWVLRGNSNIEYGAIPAAFGLVPTGARVITRVEFCDVGLMLEWLDNAITGGADDDTLCRSCEYDGGSL